MIKCKGIQIVQNHEKGGSLTLFLDTAFNEKEAKMWMIKILKSLQILHDNKLVHGNLKPNNVLLDKGILKLTDINMFKNTNYLHSLYSAPEVLKNNQITHKSDIWSACLIFMEMRLGKMPYLEDKNMTIEKLKEKIDRLDLKLPFDQETLNFVKMMHQINPDKRRTARDLLNSKYLKNEVFDGQSILTHQKRLATKNFDMSLVASKLMSDYWGQKSFNGDISSQKGMLTKGNTTYYDKANDKSTKYGLVSVLTIANIKDKDYQQQESYMPISVANLMLTTQLTNNGGISQLLQKDDTSSQNHKQDQQNKANDQNKEYNLKEKQTISTNLSTNLTAMNIRQQLNSMINMDDIKDEKKKKQQKRIKQEAGIQEDEHDDDDDDQQNDQKQSINTRQKNESIFCYKTDNVQQKNINTLGSNFNSNSNNFNSTYQNSNFQEHNQEQDQLKEIEQDQDQNELRKQQQNEIEQRLLDILNQQYEGDGSASFIGQGSQDLDRSLFANGAKDRKNSFEVPMVISNNIIQTNKKFSSHLSQQQSIQLQSLSQNKLKSQNTGLTQKNQEQCIEEMYRILNDNQQKFSTDSLEEIKKQLSNKDLNGLKKMLTLSSIQKTSNSIKTQKTLGTSQIQKIKQKQDQN